MELEVSDTVFADDVVLAAFVFEVFAFGSFATLFAPFAFFAFFASFATLALFTVFPFRESATTYFLSAGGTCPLARCCVVGDAVVGPAVDVLELEPRPLLPTLLDADVVTASGGGGTGGCSAAVLAVTDVLLAAHQPQAVPGFPV